MRWRFEMQRTAPLGLGRADLSTKIVVLVSRIGRHCLLRRAARFTASRKRSYDVWPPTISICSLGDSIEQD